MELLSENELKIANNAILLIKRVAIDISKSNLVNQKLNFTFAVPVENCIANDKKGALVVEKYNQNEVGVELRNTHSREKTYGFTLKAIIVPEITYLGKMKIIEWPSLDLYRISTVIKPYQILGFKHITKEVKEEYWEAIENVTSKIKSHVASKRSARIELASGELPVFRIIGRLKMDCSSGGEITKITLNRPQNCKRHAVQQFSTVKHNSIIDGNKNERIEINNPSRAKTIRELVFEWKIQLLPVKFYQEKFGYPSKKSYKSLTGPKNEFLFKGNEFWNTDDIDIQKVAKTTKDMDDIWEIHRFLFEFTNRRINYDANGIRYTSSQAFHEKIGDCSEFSDLLITLHRLSGIPSRLKEGMIVIPNKDGTYSLEGHAWVEFLSPKGWIPTDPTWGIPIGVSAQHIEFQTHTMQPAPPSFSFESIGPKPQVSWELEVIAVK